VSALHSFTDAARLFGVREAQLRYWLQTGFIWPSVREGKSFYYTLNDLLAVRVAVELLDTGVPLASARAAVSSLRKTLSEKEQAPFSRIQSDGQFCQVVPSGAEWSASEAPLIVDFSVQDILDRMEECETETVEEVTSTLAPPPPPEPIANVPERPAVESAAPDTALEEEELTEKHLASSAYDAFMEGLRADDANDATEAVAAYEKALEAEPAMTAARINLGNIKHAQGDWDEAQRHYEIALAADPELANARTNLASLYDDQGRTDLAIAELRQVCSRQPEFPDAHYNLGVILARLGGRQQAVQHLAQFIELAPTSDYVSHAREYIESGASLSP